MRIRDGKIRDPGMEVGSGIIPDQQLQIQYRYTNNRERKNGYLLYVFIKVVNTNHQRNRGGRCYYNKTFRQDLNVRMTLPAHSAMHSPGPPSRGSQARPRPRPPSPLLFGNSPSLFLDYFFHALVFKMSLAFTLTVINWCLESQLKKVTIMVGMTEFRNNFQFLLYNKKIMLD